MNISFDENICGNFNIAANKEWLETNELGGYAASTIYGLNNRRYHGLFVIPVGKRTEKTIILSTHILSEVEATCDRVIIIDEGSIIADDRTGNAEFPDAKTAVSGAAC